MGFKIGGTLVRNAIKVRKEAAAIPWRRSRKAYREAMRIDPPKKSPGLARV